MDPDQLYCEHCGRKLRPDRAVWVNVDAATAEPVAPDVVTESSGLQVYGAGCVKALGIRRDWTMRFDWAAD